MAEHPALSDNAVKLIVAAYEGSGNFAGRFKVNVGPGPAYIAIGQFEVRDRIEVLRLTGELKQHGLAAPESKETDNGSWQLTAKGIAEAEFHGAGKKNPEGS